MILQSIAGVSEDCNRFLQYSSQWFVVNVNCHLSSISVDVKSSEAIDSTKHLFLNWTIAFCSFS